MYCTNGQVIIIIIVVVVVVMYSRYAGCEYQSISAIVFVVFLYFAPVIYW